MPNLSTSSLLGAAFDSPGSTVDFALLTKANGNNDSEWVYVKVSGTCLTGTLVAILNAGTALACTTAYLVTAASVGTELAWCQTLISDQQCGWVAKRGNNMYVGCSGTCAMDTQLYLAGSAGYLTTTAGSATMAGIVLLASASTASLVVTTALLTYPRAVAQLS